METKILEFDHGNEEQMRKYCEADVIATNHAIEIQNIHRKAKRKNISEGVGYWTMFIIFLLLAMAVITMITKFIWVLLF